MSKLIVFILTGFLAFSCTSKEDEIIKELIDSHGGKSYKILDVSFNFRGINYHLKRNNGVFDYQRIQLDSLGNETKDILTNDSFVRYQNNVEMPVLDSMAFKYKNSINSVAYFFILPYGLQDPAVNKLYEQDVLIKGVNYHQIKVLFEEDGGGVDHQDIYLFWVNANTKRLDYLAYSYETDGGGVRFREAINGQEVGPYYFQDYNNYGYEDMDYSLNELPKDLENGKLPFLSKIENENITLEN